MTKLIAIDPGDRWTGVAFFDVNADGEWFCEDAQEFGREEFEDALGELIITDYNATPEYIVWEKWRLYADKANAQTGSEFEATQLIGVIKYLIRIHNEHVDRHELAEKQGKMMTCELQGGTCEDPANQPHRITTKVQGAEIKKPTRGILNKKKIKSVARPIAKAEYGNRDHIVDAELHGWKYILDVLDGVAEAA